MLVRKLDFLQRLVVEDENNLHSRMLWSLKNDTESVCLVRQCREFEEAYGTSCTNRMQKWENTYILG